MKTSPRARPTSARSATASTQNPLNLPLDIAALLKGGGVAGLKGAEALTRAGKISEESRLGKLATGERTVGINNLQVPLQRSATLQGRARQALMDKAGGYDATTHAPFIGQARRATKAVIREANQGGEAARIQQIARQFNQESRSLSPAEQTALVVAREGEPLPSRLAYFQHQLERQPGNTALAGHVAAYSDPGVAEALANPSAQLQHVAALGQQQARMRTSALVRAGELTPQAAEERRFLAQRLIGGATGTHFDPELHRDASIRLANAKRAFQPLAAPAGYQVESRITQLGQHISDIKRQLGDAAGHLTETQLPRPVESTVGRVGARQSLAAELQRAEAELGRLTIRRNARLTPAYHAAKDELAAAHQGLKDVKAQRTEAAKGGIVGGPPIESLQQLEADRLAGRVDIGIHSSFGPAYRHPHTVPISNAAGFFTKIASLKRGKQELGTGNLNNGVNYAIGHFSLHPEHFSHDSLAAMSHLLALFIAAVAERTVTPWAASTCTVPSLCRMIGRRGSATSRPTSAAETVRPRLRFSASVSAGSAAAATTRSLTSKYGRWPALRNVAGRSPRPTENPSLDAQTPRHLCSRPPGRSRGERPIFHS